MIIYCMSDIHGCLAEFEDALSLVLDDIEQGKAKLVLLGDYIHGGPDNRWCSGQDNEAPGTFRFGQNYCSARQPR